MKNGTTRVRTIGTIQVLGFDVKHELWREPDATEEIDGEYLRDEATIPARRQRRGRDPWDTVIADVHQCFAQQAGDPHRHDRAKKNFFPGLRLIRPEPLRLRAQRPPLGGRCERAFEHAFQPAEALIDRQPGPPLALGADPNVCIDVEHTNAHAAVNKNTVMGHVGSLSPGAASGCARRAKGKHDENERKK